MKFTISLIFIASCLLLTATAFSLLDNRESGSTDYDLTWHTIDAGGGTSSGGSFQLSGTIGQPDAGVMSGGSYELAGGYWTHGGTVEPACPTDLTGDGQINVSDLLALLAAWGPCPGCAADLNGDNTVNVSDLLALLAAWGACPD